ncbi:MarR family winged helix-turn-helix transcriptional regulator [Streptacidiphilus jiangxiensis]|uniref:DNA-binding transcriptional regulator, MarR family n=1 Tax=Streptacidiphilus jiangxiensis TaxID=235985 RepID=A0A1H7VIB2_STRJI|nr:MarR family transcriptional regulator [Streptacidiphilus jiangxiensis]SEM08860.1 DNA-binding transcriptional regulator, MarR family [Streptacidiphilus jiangxiensis]
MTNEPGHEIADALGVLLTRSTREHLHAALTEGLGEAVDALTYPLLSGLDRAGARSAADLGREIGLDRTTVTRRADRLQRAGLLRRDPDPCDARATLLALTDAGEAVVATTRGRLAAHIDASLASWPAEDARTFSRLLHRFVTDGPFTGEAPRH